MIGVFTMTSQTYVIGQAASKHNAQANKVDGYKYTYMAKITDDNGEENNITLREFADIAVEAINRIFGCGINNVVKDIEVSKDNITFDFSIRFFTDRDLQRDYTAEFRVEDGQLVGVPL